jgi:acyl carrier protein
MENALMMDDLRKILSPYVPDKSVLTNLNENTNLITDLKINSAHVIDVILDAETHYGIEIDNDSIEKMVTVGGCIKVIKELKNKT